MLPPIAAGASCGVSIVRAMAIRSYRPGDRAAVYDICLRTGDAGADASHLVSDPELPGHVYAGPYLALCPELAFVLELPGAVAGYVIGALDTRAFVDAYRERWLPRLAGSHPPPAGPPATHEERLLDVLHRPELLLTPSFPEHPSHLHVNLLPGARAGARDARWSRRSATRSGPPARPASTSASSGATSARSASTRARGSSSSATTRTPCSSGGRCAATRSG